MEQLELFPELRPLSREDWLKRLEQEAKIRRENNEKQGEKNGGVVEGL